MSENGIKRGLIKIGIGLAVVIGIAAFLLYRYWKHMP